MSECPKCQTPISESAFGLYTCPSCSSVLNVDMDGQSYFAESAPESLSNTPEEIITEPVAVQESANENSLVKEIKDNYTEAIYEDLSGKTVTIDPYQLPDRQVDLSSSNFDDVVRYAQSETSNASDGSYYYDVLLAGIDSEDLRLAVREALRDVRFGWQVEDQMNSIRRGTLLLSKLNSVKASLVVNRLKTYPIKILWSQNGILESDT